MPDDAEAVQEQLAYYRGRALVLVDGSREMLALASARLDSRKVRCAEADIFMWKRDEKFDVVFFSFWLSRVPPSRFDEYWGLVGSCLAPGGRVFFIDSIHDETSTATDHHLPPAEAMTLKRRLNDGREFSIFKLYYGERELESKLAGLGWRFDVASTERYFLYASGTRA